MAMKNVSGGGKGSPGIAGGTRTSSVKVVPARRTAMDEAQRISANRAETNKVAERKSGALAKTTASRVNTNPAPSRTGRERITVKVNSAPAKSAKAKAAAKVEAKALKAANKKLPKKNY
jgi:hypothetical protein